MAPDTIWHLHELRWRLGLYSALLRGEPRAIAEHGDSRLAELRGEIARLPGGPEALAAFDDAATQQDADTAIRIAYCLASDSISAQLVALRAQLGDSSEDEDAL